MADKIDPIVFASSAIDELKARLANATNPSDRENFGKTDEQIVLKFFDDQGHNFGQVDVPAVLALVKEKEQPING